MKDMDRWWNLNSPYAYRNENLARLGFRSYRDYLKSDLWKDIRTRVLERAGGKCEKCHREKSLQVHHRSYDPATLRGDCLNSLTAACAKCHQKAEQPDDLRQEPYERLQRANKTLLRGWRKTQRRANGGPLIPRLVKPT